MESLIVIIPFILYCVGAFLVYIIPTVAAFYRNHHFKWVIAALNIFFGVTAIGWLVALVWAVWPGETPWFIAPFRDIVTNKENKQGK